METELEKIDTIRSRFRVTYEEARKALSESSGDVVAALGAIEREHSSRADLFALGAEMADEIQKVITGSPIRKLRVRYGHKTLTETPVVLKAAAAVAVSLAAALISKLIIEVEKEEEEAAS